MIFYFYRIKICRESGLYDEWIQDVLRYSRKRLRTIHMNDINKDIFSVFEFTDLNMDGLFDLFYMIGVGHLVSIILIVLEIFLHKYKLKCLMRYKLIKNMSVKILNTLSFNNRRFCNLLYYLRWVIYYKIKEFRSFILTVYNRIIFVYFARNK